MVIHLLSLLLIVFFMNITGNNINEENNQIANLYNKVSLRGGFITHEEQQELQRHIQLRNEYEMKSMKHFMSGSKDAGNIVNKFF